MGTKVGPSIANVYVFLLEKKWLNIYNPFYYKRFIDDIFVLVQRMFLDQIIESLKHAFGNLTLNIEYGQKMVFLDLNIEIDHICNKLDFSLYTKPTNTYSFLLTTSNHPNHIFKNIPKSLFIRLRRNNSKLHNFLHFSRILTWQLIKRGYDYVYLNKLVRNIAKTNRDDLLKYKDKNNKFKQIDNKTFIFTTSFE